MQLHVGAEAPGDDKTCQLCVAIAAAHYHKN